MPSPRMPLRPGGESKESTLEELKQRIHGKLVDKLDLTKVGELEGKSSAAKSASSSSTSATVKTRC